MTRHYERRTSQSLFYDAAHDRRRVGWDRRKQDVVPVAPGAIRPGVGEAAPRVERRRVPGSGEE